MTDHAEQADASRIRVDPRALLGFVVYLILLPLLLLGTAGTLSWWQGWVWIAFTLVGGLGSRWLMARRHPDLVTERSRVREHRDVAPGDRALVALMAIYGPLLVLVFAGLDRRFGWTERWLGRSIPTWCSIAALALAFAGLALATRAMLENRFFSAVVRIQQDRGHRLCDSGPYRLVRHPGYLGALLTMVACPIALGSAIALLATLVPVIATLVRTAREDRYLTEHLQGYADFRRRTGWRLLPGIW